MSVLSDLPFIERLGMTLVHSVWQIALVALLAMVFARVLRHSTAATRYVMLVSMFLTLMLSPLVTWNLLSVEGELVSASTTDDQGTSTRVGAIDVGATSSDSPSGARLPAQAEIGPAPIGPIVVSENGSSAKSLPARIRVALQPWLSVIVAGWIFGACLFALRPALSFWTVWRLRRHAVSPASKAIEATLIRVRRQMGLKQTIAIVESSLARVPMMIGHFRPLILLPMSVASGLPASHLEAILAHELAHIRRHDYLINALQTLVETIFFFHPAVWWLSYRIRTERENCCDDLAIAATGNRLAYGRALLALEDLRGASPSLALGAHGGSLADRIRRLAPADSQRGSFGAFGITGFAAIAVVAGMGIWSMVAADGQAQEPWGPESSGLICRIVPVDASMSENAVDMSRTVTAFAAADDVTFGVELKNTGDSPITLLGAQYGESFKTVKGQWNTNHFAPHLFEFAFTAADGRPAPRAHREFPVDTQFMILRGASVHSLMPGASLKFLLRPTHFERSMDYRLAPGDYRVKVRYRGPRPAVLDKIREHWPDKPHLKAWAHEVTSNEARFSIAPDLQAPGQLVWGPAKDGLQAALEIRVPRGTEGNPNAAPGVLVGVSLHAILHVKNVSDQPITFVSESPRQGDQVHVTNAAGEHVEVRDVWISGLPIDVRWTLRPGDVAHLAVLTPSLSDLDQPGHYAAHYTIRFNSRIQKDDEGNIVFPAPGDWQSELDTGKTPLFLRTEPLKISAHGEIHGRLVDDDTGKPIRGATVTCAAITKDSDRGGRADSKTDSAGKYRLRPPAPGIYTVWLKKHPRSSRALAPADEGVQVEAGKIAASELRVADAKYLAGKVVDENGQPVKSIVVSCYSTSQPQPGGSQRIRTKADGSFSFFIPPGRAYLYVTARGERAKDDPFRSGLRAAVELDVPRLGQPDAVTITH